MLNTLLNKTVLLEDQNRKPYTAEVPRFFKLQGSQPVTVTPLGDPLEGWINSDSVTLNSVGSSLSREERTLSIVG